jgi:hypothetical protein
MNIQSDEDDNDSIRLSLKARTGKKKEQKLTSDAQRKPKISSRVDTLDQAQVFLTQLPKVE